MRPKEKAKAGLGESGRKRKKEANCIDDHVAQAESHRVNGTIGTFGSFHWKMEHSSTKAKKKKRKMQVRTAGRRKRLGVNCKVTHQCVTLSCCWNLSFISIRCMTYHGCHWHILEYGGSGGSKRYIHRCNAECSCVFGCTFGCVYICECLYVCVSSYVDVDVNGVCIWMVFGCEFVWSSSSCLASEGQSVVSFCLNLASVPFHCLTSEKMLFPLAALLCCPL